MKTITIQGLAFDAPEPYSAGHTLADNEATALNQTFAENLRNNFAKTVAMAKDEHGDELPKAILASLHDQFDDYASTYTFAAKRHGEVNAERAFVSKVNAGKVSVESMESTVAALQAAIDAAKKKAA